MRTHSLGERTCDAKQTHVALNSWGAKSVAAWQRGGEAGEKPSASYCGGPAPRNRPAGRCGTKEACGLPQGEVHLPAGCNLRPALF